jgi:hypothetical protein
LSVAPLLGSCPQGSRKLFAELGPYRNSSTPCLHLSSFSEGSYMIVLCSKLRRSNMRTLPSAPQLTNTSTLFAQNLTSKTSLSCAISWVLAVRVGMSHIVQVVSMLEVMIKLGESVFQSRDVRGAVCSGDLEFDKRARGVSFCTFESPALLRPVIELD